MKPSLSPWGVLLLVGASAALSTVDCAPKTTGGLFWDGYAKSIVSSCYEDYEVATAKGIFTMFLRPLLYETCLADTDDVVRMLRGGASDCNETNPTKAKEDIVRIVLETRGGGGNYNQPNHIANSTFVVADEQARGEKEPTIQLCTRSEGLLEDLRARPKLEHDAPDISGSPTSTTTTGTTTTTTATTTTTTTIGTAESRGTHVDSSGDETAARKGSEHRPLTSETSLSRRKADMLKTITPNGNNRTPAASKLHRNSSYNLIVNKRVVDVFKHPKNDRHINSIAESKPNLFQGSGNSHLVIKSDSGFGPRYPWMKQPTYYLQVGDARMRTLRLAEGRTNLWSERVDGSLRFEKYPTPSSMDDPGQRGTDLERMKSTNLPGSNPETPHKVVFTLGETLTGTLRFAEGELALPPQVDGSSRFRKHPAQPSVEDAGGRGTGTTAMRSTNSLLSSEPKTARNVMSTSNTVCEEESGKKNLLSSGSEISGHVLSMKKTTVPEDDGKTNMPSSDAEIARNVLSTNEIALQDQNHGGEGEGPTALQSTYLLNSDHETLREMPSRRRIVLRGQGDDEEEARQGAMLPMNLLSADPETVRDVLSARKIILQGMGGGGETAEPGETRPMNVKASGPEKGREVLTTRRLVLLGEGSKANLLTSYPDKVQEVLTTVRAVLQEEDGNMLRSDPQMVPEVVSMQKAVLNEEGGKGSDSGGVRKGTVGGWLPWAKHPKEDPLNHLFAATTDMEGPMCVSEAKRGCVLETVDGATVVSKSGHFTWDWVSRFPWKRPKDHKHQEQVTEEKLEVRVGGRKLWGITEDEWMG